MWIEPATCFAVKESALDGAGEGLFAMKKIAKGTVFPIEHSRPRFTDRVPSGVEVLPLNASMEDVDIDGPCIVDKRLARLRDAPKPSSLRPRFVHAARDRSIMMKANDLAWSPQKNAREYNAETWRNQLELVVEFSQGRAVGVVAVMQRDAVPNEEVGITYGIDYWEYED